MPDPEKTPSRERSPAKLLLTAEEAAQQLGLSRTQVFRLISSKRLRSMKIGRLRRIPGVALSEFIASSERVDVAS